MIVIKVRYLADTVSWRRSRQAEHLHVVKPHQPAGGSSRRSGPCPAVGIGTSA